MRPTKVCCSRSVSRGGGGQCGRPGRLVNRGSLGAKFTAILSSTYSRRMSTRKLQRYSTTREERPSRLGDAEQIASLILSFVRLLLEAMATFAYPASRRRRPRRWVRPSVGCSRASTWSLSQATRMNVWFRNTLGQQHLRAIGPATPGIAPSR